MNKKEEVKSDGEADKPKYDSLGPDVLRLWVASSDYTSDVAMAVPVLQEVQQALAKYRVTTKWVLGCLSDFSPSSPSTDIPDEGLTFADQAVLYRLRQTSVAVWDAYAAYEFHRGVKAVNHFFNNELSAFYFEVCKDGMYTGSDAVRHRTQTVLWTILREALTWLAPVTPHLVEEAWEFMPARLKGEEGEHPLKRVWTRPDEATSGDGEVERGLEALRELSAAVKLAQEAARRAGDLKNGLNCKVVLCGSCVPRQVLDWDERGELAGLLVVSQVEVVGNEGRRDDSGEKWRYTQSVPVEGGAEVGSGYKVEIIPPAGEKCVRCWRSTAEEKDGTCGRCRDVLAERGT